ncbi:MAG: T9SS type A sorting domain-containing protein [Flavobacteriales bacterium]|nr:T9SS type A sorting domain-containing protein [Flavobacteriales bacterium]
MLISVPEIDDQPFGVSVSTESNSIKVNGDPALVSVFNINGVLIKEINHTSQSTIQVSETGIYLVRVTTSERSFTRKVYLH